MAGVQEYVDKIDDAEARQRAVALLIAKELLSMKSGFLVEEPLTNDYVIDLTILAEYILYGWPVDEDEVDPALVEALDELEAEGLIERVPNEEVGDGRANDA